MATLMSSARFLVCKFGYVYCFRDIRPVSKFYTSKYLSTNTVADVLRDCSGDEQFPKNVMVKGWVKSIRQHKDTTFLSLHDSTSRETLQVVTCTNKVDGVTFGACIAASGEIVTSPYPHQKVELRAHDLRVVGACDPSEFPLATRSHQKLEYIRQFPHLRPKIDVFGRLLRIRNSARVAIHKYFQDAKYCHIDTPVITTNDCEGAGEAFTVKTEQEVDRLKRGDDDQRDFFGRPTFLTVSGQLHLEAAAGAFARVYTLGPTFRAEKSMTRHHLSEFYMLEAEICFIDELEDLTTIIEDSVKKITGRVLETSGDDVDEFWAMSGDSYKELITKMVEQPFIRISYTDAVEILEKHNDEFQFKISWGMDLQKEHERYLVTYFDDTPVFIRDFPSSLKPFYAKPNPQRDTVAACDLLVPGVGELVGGSLRNTSLDSLCKRLHDDTLASSLSWYLDLRKFGCSPHGGFGMGFERYLQYLLGVKHIRDVIPFPRSLNNCKL